jgi:exodeoxyribonuclease-5
MILNDQQLDAIKKIVKWYFCNSSERNYFCCFGYAGTGKSTVVNIAIKMLGLPLSDVIFCTLTGKASLVLRMKGNPSNTIHRTFYSVFKKGNSFLFSLKRKIPSNVKLIVIDEVSMVTKNMLNDILGFGVPTLCLGDPGQLLPVGAPNMFLEHPELANVFLTKVMRQDDSSGILELANLARNEQLPEYREYKLSKVVQFNDVIDDVDKYDMVVCYSNKMRRYLNKFIRTKKGYTSIYPQKGEKIVCLMNNYNYCIEYEDVPINIVNGMVGICNKDSIIIDENNMELVNIDFTPDFLTEKNIMGNLHINSKAFCEIFEQYEKDISKEAFIEELYNDSIEDDKLGEVCMIDFGYAITCHKSQGSEADNVLVIVEPNIPKHMFFKWLYTGITRAKKSVTVATI